VLPEAIASFGAARVGPWLYVFGGHVGRQHEHSTANVVGSFRRVHLETHAFEELPSGPPLQGTALVAAPDGSVYRIGGLTAHNAPGAAEDLHSTASVQRFDPRIGAWEDATPLPEPRSSHDAVVLDGKVWVAGGWQLDGGEEGKWHATAWVADLGETPLRWTPLPDPPFHRRACALAVLGHRIAVLGGIDSETVSCAVDLYDPATRAWSVGPELLSSGFGAAALAVGDELFATTMDGRVLRLPAAGDAWIEHGRLALPRLFHRLVSSPDGTLLFALGGAGRGGHMRNVEAIPLGPTPLVNEWVVPFPGAARYRETVLLADHELWLFGGNRKDGRERFAPDQFTDEIWRVSLASLAAARAGTLPEARQSMAEVALDPRAADTLLLGGLGPGHGANGARSHAGAFSYARGSQTARAFGAAMPGPRTQFHAVLHDGKVWVFGGIDFTPDASGNGTATHPTDVLVCDPRQDPPAFVSSGIELPRPRRSFGGALLGTKYWLIGGLGAGFDPAEGCDAFDFATRTWETAPPPPRAWISPQVCTIGERAYLACGGTMQGMKFTEDRALAAFDLRRGWSTVVPELPFAVRHARMLRLGEQLLFCTLEDESGGRLVLRALGLPAEAATAPVVEATFQR
jgi:hypothetical protein